MVPFGRILHANNRPIQGGKDYVLYWMTANRRRRFNFALQRAVEWAEELRKPLLVVEGLNCNYPWASDRIHQFVIDGMRANAVDFSGSPVAYLPLISRGTERDRRIHAFTRRAAVIVTDDFPAFVVPRWTESMTARSRVLVECVDASGLLPFRSTSRVFETAHSRRLPKMRSPP